MRGSSVFVAFLALVACSSRTADYPVDYTEEVERICDAVCEKDTTCVDAPPVGYDECFAACNMPGGMHDDTVCGEAFRAWFGCIGNTSTCEEYLDTWNVDAVDYTCMEEAHALAELKCGAQDGND